MMSIKKTSLSISVLILLFLSIYLIFFPPLKFYNNLFDKKSSSLDIEVLLQQNFQNQNNQNIRLSNLIDKPLIITTGFTRCPYTCPLTMIFLNRLKNEFKDSISTAFLTVDPSYDTPQVLKTYLEPQPHHIIGLRIKDPDELNIFLKKIGQNTYSKSAQFYSSNENQAHHKSFVVLLAPSRKPQLFLDQNFKEITSEIYNLLKP